MSDSPPTAPQLQFDRADYGTEAAPALTCASCQQVVTTTYFEVDGQTTCPACQGTLARLAATRPGAAGVVRALGAGLAAAVAGSILYYAVLALTGYEIGLVAIAVGYMVGFAVRWGSGGRGGPLYQTLAVGLTYLAIVSTYVPFILNSAPPPDATTASVADPGSDAPAAATEAGPQPVSTTTTPEPEPVELGAAQVVVPFAVLIGLLLALPFLAGFSNIIGIAIIGFALFEAWKLTRRVEVSISGPFTVTRPVVPPPIPTT